MNGIEKIVEYIMSRSTVDCESIEIEAAEESIRIQADYAKLQQEEYWRIFDAGAKEADSRLKRLNSLAAIESRKQILVTEQEMISAAFDLAVEKLLQLPDREYTALLVKLACNASITGEEVIILSAADHQRFGTDVLDAANAMLRNTGKKATLSLSDETINIRGGLILSGGNVEVNCSVDALVAQQRIALSPVIASMLFE